MSRLGSNLPLYRSLQLDFTAHVRNPAENPIPEGLESRRMKIYLDLLFNNVENFLSSTFPIARSLYTLDDWHALVRDYLHRHRATSPYFLEISQEFLQFLGTDREGKNDPPWLLELCHYEWVELALDVADLEQPWDLVDLDAPAESSAWIVSPLIWPLSYRYPVHRIGPKNGTNIQEQPTFLVVFRDGADKVRFMESDGPTLRFLELLAEEMALGEALTRLADELPVLGLEGVRKKMLPTLTRLQQAEVVLGPAKQLPETEPG